MHCYQCTLQMVQTLEGLGNRTNPPLRVAPFIPKRSHDQLHVCMMTSLMTSSYQNDVTLQKTQVPSVRVRRRTPLVWDH